MRHLHIKSLAGILALPLFFISCNDEDEKPDLATQVSGTYNYKLEVYIENGSQLEYLGTDFDDTGTAIVSKTSSGIEMKEGGEVLLTGSNLAASRDGVVFHIETQTIEVDGQEVVVRGYNGVDMEGEKYNAIYESSPKELSAYMYFDGVYTDEDGESFDVRFVIQIVGRKV